MKWLLGFLLTCLIYSGGVLHAADSSGVVRDSIENLPPPVHTRPITSNKYFAGEKDDYGIWVNDNTWVVSTDKLNKSSDMEFEHIDGDAYVIVIHEDTKLTWEQIREVALQNARSAAINAGIVFEERRIVNGNEILCLRINGTIDMVPFTYFGYYYVGRIGIIQMITFTNKNLFDEYEDDFENFLDGLDISKT